MTAPTQPKKDKISEAVGGLVALIIIGAAVWGIVAWATSGPSPKPEHCEKIIGSHQVCWKDKDPAGRPIFYGKD